MGLINFLYNITQRFLAFFLLELNKIGEKQVFNYIKYSSKSTPNIFENNINDLGEKTIGDFLFRSNSEIDVFDDFVEDPSILPIGAVLALAVSRTDKGHLRKYFLKNRFGRGVIGSNKMGNPFKKIGKFQSIKIKTALTSIDKSNEGIEYDVLFRSSFLGMRDWSFHNSTLYLLTHPYLIKIDEFGKITKMKFNKLASPHSMYYSKNQESFLVTSTGNDLLVSFDDKTNIGRVLWSAIENGINYSIGKDTIFVTYKKIPKNDIAYGYKIKKVKKYSDLATSLQVMHINSAIEDDQGNIFFTAFATKKVNHKTGSRIYLSGSGGKVCKLKPNNQIEDVLGGLSNPHGLLELESTNNGRIYALTETSRGFFNFYNGEKFKLIKRLKFESAVRRIQNNVNIWLMEMSISCSVRGDIYMTAFSDGPTPGIFILKISKDLKLTRWFANVPDDWAIQKVAISNI